MKKKIGVLGCSGAVGKHVVSYLAGRYPLLCGQRSPYKPDHPNVEWQKTDLFDEASLDRFCGLCDIVINAAGPSSEIKDLVAKAALRNGLDCVEASGETIFLEREEDKYQNVEQTIAVGAGFEAGLSGVILDAFSHVFDVPESAECYLGSRQPVSETSLADLLYSCFIDSGYANSCYEDGKIVPAEVAAEQTFSVLGFREEVYLKTYLSSEMIQVAKKCGLKRTTRYHAIADREIVDLMAGLYQRVNEIQGTDYRKNIMEESLSLFDAISNTKPPFNTMLYQLTGLKDGERIRRSAFSSSIRLQNLWTGRCYDRCVLVD